jgi:hypothetical protein
MASTLAAQNPADVVNQALAKMGYKLRVGSLFDGSLAAKKALDIYAQTRDQLLRQGDFDFSKQIVAAALTGQVAPLPWSNEYVYPANCLKVRDIFGVAYASSPNNPLPVLWTIGDNPNTVKKVIWTNINPATLVYTAQITDPTLWETSFTEALADGLRTRLTPLLASLELEKIAAEDEKAAIATAEAMIG